MAIKNKYFYRSHISEEKFREIIRLFSADLTALQIASLTKIKIQSIIFLKNLKKLDAIRIKQPSGGLL